MKFKFLFAVSVVLNIVAAWLLIGHHSSSNTPAGSLSPALPTAASRPAEVFASREQPAAVSRPPTVGWVEALRDAGISEKMIGDVASASFEDRWHKLALEKQKAFDHGDIDHAALMAFDLEHDGEQEKDMRKALGEESFRRWDQTRLLADLDRAGVQLSSSESDKLYDMRKGLDRKRLELDKARQQGAVTDQDAASQSEAIQSQYNEQMLKLLGDDRYAQFQGGGDTGIGELKQNLQGVNAGDSQIAGIEAAQQAWNTQHSGLDLKLQKGEIPAEEYEKQTKALEDQRDQQYKQVLGADSFVAFQRNQDERYQRLKSLGAGMGFADDDINNLYASIQTYQNDVSDYRTRAQSLEGQGQTVDWPGVEKVLQDFSQQTENALRDKLGDKFDKLKRSNIMPFER